jgi:hypothetical protein
LEIAKPNPVPPHFLVCPCFHLAEFVEEDSNLVFRDADAGVAHRKVQQAIGISRFFERYAYCNFAFFGEFDGIADQVGENLAQTPWIAAELGRNLWAAMQISSIPFASACSARLAPRF